MTRWYRRVGEWATNSYREELATVQNVRWLALVRCAYFLAWTIVASVVRGLVWIALWGVGRTLPWKRLVKGYSDHQHIVDLDIPDDADEGVLSDLVSYSQGALDRAHARRDFIMGKAAQVLVLDGAVFVILGLGGSGGGSLRIAAAVFALVSVLLTARAFGPLWWSEPRLEPPDLAKNVKKVIVESQLAAARRTTQTIDVLTDVVAAAVNWGALAVFCAGVAVLVPVTEVEDDPTTAAESGAALRQPPQVLSGGAPTSGTSTPEAPSLAEPRDVSDASLPTTVLERGAQPPADGGPTSTPTTEGSGPPPAKEPPGRATVPSSDRAKPVLQARDPREAAGPGPADEHDEHDEQSDANERDTPPDRSRTDAEEVTPPHPATQPP